MNIIELAKEAGFSQPYIEAMQHELKRFAVLVRAEALKEDTDLTIAYMVGYEKGKDAKAEPVTYKPYKVKLPTIMVGRNWHSEEIQRWLDELPPLYVGPVRAEPVKQEPVAWMYDVTAQERNGWVAQVNEVCRVDPSFAHFASNIRPLYPAPVDAKAIRAEALEEAAKVCDEKASGDIHDKYDDGFVSGADMCAAAIRGLK